MIFQPLNVDGQNGWRVYDGLLRVLVAMRYDLKNL